MHISTQDLDLNSRIHLPCLQFPAQTARSKYSAVRQIGQAGAVSCNDHITGIFSFRYRADTEPFRKFHRKIFGTVHRKIDLASQKCLFPALL